VTLGNGALTIQDVDFGSNSTWQDFVAVQAFNGAAPIAVTYSILAAHALTSQFGFLASEVYRPSRIAALDRRTAMSA
jgi:hypothetical protein